MLGPYNRTKLQGRMFKALSGLVGSGCRRACLALAVDPSDLTLAGWVLHRHAGTEHWSEILIGVESGLALVLTAVTRPCGDVGRPPPSTGKVQCVMLNSLWAEFSTQRSDKSDDDVLAVSGQRWLPSFTFVRYRTVTLREARLDAGQPACRLRVHLETVHN
ncbi:hypothetical protein BGZ61DRAFT_206094 [Ilyonectria robusta]|uniref:uncharacterized protein n=1 Tax=Ilyonectria robusta TaxID=1079257 RepID=UPI001E8EF23E|nr:uncharacterized protein BGZ61DRAFT_206094 [Ilyonectria robusta]KAH8714102.1 hypothetical protein BGZ61DRAFT_206094 [Ilyonectria robusta]